MKIAYMGVDPGKTGAVAIIWPDGKASLYTMPDTDMDVCDLVGEVHSMCALSDYELKCVIERVQPMPGHKKDGGTRTQGVVSAFTFARGFGFLLGCVSAFRIPVELVLPRKWQTSLGCLTGGDKNISKARAQQLFPDMGKHITKQNADALLIAEYGRRNGM